MRTKKTNRSPRKRGAQLAELPPALMLLLFVFFFPLLNMLYLLCAFGAGWYLNCMELREVACRPPLATPPTGTPTPVADLNTSLHWNNFMGVSEISPPDVTQTQDFYSTSNSNLTSSSPSEKQLAQDQAAKANNNLTGKSYVTTHVSIRPFLTIPFLQGIPWLSQVPGVGKPILFDYTNSIMQEDTGQ